MNPTFTIPAKLRMALNLLLAVSAPVVTHGIAKGWIGTQEAVLFGSLASVIAAIAGLHVPFRTDPQATYPAPEDPSRTPPTTQPTTSAHLPDPSTQAP